jgi:hypothetical protein
MRSSSIAIAKAKERAVCPQYGLNVCALKHSKRKTSAIIASQSVLARSSCHSIVARPGGAEVENDDPPKGSKE